jgi:hypothetical protein
MRATIEYVESKFEEFNRLMFSGRLPKLPVKLTDAGSFLGKCECQQRRLPSGLLEYFNFSISINTRIDLPENVVEDTIIHEMIHYLILWSGLHDTSAHGDIFKSIMTSINTAYGRNITIRHSGSEEEKEQAVSTKRKWHVIAAVYLKSGKIGIKVLPRTMNKIIAYYNSATANREVAEVKLYLHDNPFFNRYPTSAALRMHEIERDLLESNLTNARKLKVNGSQVLEA